MEWFALEMNRDHSVILELASKYCISDSFADHDGYSISFEGFLPAVVDIMIIWVKFTGLLGPVNFSELCFFLFVKISNIQHSIFKFVNAFFGLLIYDLNPSVKFLFQLYSSCCTFWLYNFFFCFFVLAPSIFINIYILLHIISWLFSCLL